MESNITEELKEKVVYVNRVAKVVKGGRRFAFSAVVVVGDGDGRVGFAIGKAREVAEAIRKGADRAKKNMIEVPRSGTTIPHQVLGRWSGARVLLKPASKGTGVIAGSSVRAVMDACGIHDILTKCLGSTSPGNVVKAVIEGLQSLRSPETVARMRGKTVEEILN